MLLDLYFHHDVIARSQTGNGGPDQNTVARSWRDTDESEHEKAFARYSKTVYAPPGQAAKPEEKVKALLPEAFTVPTPETPAALPFTPYDLAPAQAALAEVSAAQADLADALRATRQRQDDEEALILLLLH